MMDDGSLFDADGLLVWGRLLGSWGREECLDLRSFFDTLELPRGSRVLLDFSDIRHLHFAGAPWLIAMAADLENRGARLHVAGLSERLRTILELGGACAAREFCERYGEEFRERYGDEGSPLPGPAEGRGREARIGGRYASDPHGLAVVGLN